MSAVMAVTTWGIETTQFLIAYVGLCVVTVAWVRWQRHKLVGDGGHGSDPLPDLGPYELALLGGGPQLAITTATAKLRRDGYMGEGVSPRTLVAVGQLPASADPLEREVFGTVHRHGSTGISVDELRREVADSDPVKHILDELTHAGLLIEPAAAKRVRRLWIAGGLLAALGIARLIAVWSDDGQSGLLFFVVIAVVIETLWTVRRRPVLTERGRSFLRTERQGGRTLHDYRDSSDLAYAVALWGGAALWSADPGFASTLGVPREETTTAGSGWTGSSGSSGIGCSGGGGGCGGGSSGCGGGGGGGGGCGGGGGGGCGGGGGGS